VLPVAFYGAQTWWPGATRLLTSGSHSNGQQGILKAFQKALISSARAILPAYRTTPSPILHREAGIPLPEHLLDALALADTARTRRLDPTHPLRARAEACLKATLGRPRGPYRAKVPAALPKDPRHTTQSTPRHARR
jgi:hypothetical protein